MWTTRSTLELCTRLHEKGQRPEFEDGEHLGRGFADVGAEEFILLPNQKLLSLFSGDKSELRESHRHFFFKIFSEPEALQELLRKGVVLEESNFVDQRTWCVKVSFLEKKMIEEDSILINCFLKLLLRLRELKDV